jgi:hypothetical protein
MLATDVNNHWMEAGGNMRVNMLCFANLAL